MKAFDLIQHLIDIFKPIPFNVLMGYGYFVFIHLFILALSFKHKKEIWQAVRGKDGELQVPELIILLSLILYIVVIMCDIFLSLKPSDGVFWSLDSVILFALTGRVFLNKFGGGKNEELAETKTTEPKKTEVLDPKPDDSKNNNEIDESLMA